MAGEPTLHPGESTGNFVSYLRDLLVWQGMDGLDHAQDDEEFDAEMFDSRLERAVRSFQEQHGLRANGVVEEDTWAALKGESATSSGGDAPANPDGEEQGAGSGGGGSDDDGGGGGSMLGGLLGMMGFDVVDLDLAEPSVRRTELRWVISNSGNAKMSKHAFYVSVVNATKGDQFLFDWSDEETNDIEAGNEHEGKLDVDTFNWLAESTMANLNEMDTYRIDVCIEPNKSWEKWGSVQFKVALDDAPSAPGEDDDNDDVWAEQVDFKKIAGFSPA